MADINVLREKVEKAKEKVMKCKGTIERHEKQLEKKRNSHVSIYDIERKEEAIKGAIDKLADAEEVLRNWNAKLQVEVEKERFLEGNAPEVIKTFLAEWKEKSFEWYIRKYEAYLVFIKDVRKQEKEARIECVKTTPDYAKYLDEDGEIMEYWQNDLQNVFPRSPMKAFLEERELDNYSIQTKKQNFAGSTVLHMATIRDEGERLAWLENELEKEKKAKMLDLINRINKVVGSIIDATHLSISDTGNLNGYIIGELGKAKVETIGAGGYNIQVFHYRTLVNKIS